MKSILIGLLWVSFSVLAAPPEMEKQIYELEAAVMRLQQEQQTLFQQFQMLRELRQHEVLREDEAIMHQGGVVAGGEFPKHEDMVKRQKERYDQIQRYTIDLKEFYARYQELESERRLLIEQLNELRLGAELPVEVE
ncbi:hypothetical protein [Nitrosomonas sp. ANs5]|uniref:hypothetical protein n=1 Tax=Nitrosomonas sp. ANs5 TaxID=3423941 RepID=UPI003D34BB36